MKVLAFVTKLRLVNAIGAGRPTIRLQENERAVDDLDVVESETPPAVTPRHEKSSYTEVATQKCR